MVTLANLKINWGGEGYCSYLVENKGGDVAQTQMSAAEARNKAAFDAQQKQLAQLNSAFSKYTTQNIGFDPTQLAAMQSQIQNQNTSQFNSAGQAVRNALLSRGSAGGSQPVGGDYVRGISGLMGAQASDLSQNLNNLRIQNAQQSLVNRFNAGNLLSGNAATLTGTQGVQAGQASNALNQYITAKNSGVLQSFMGGLGGGLGAGIGGFAGGALTGIFKPKPAGTT